MSLLELSGRPYTVFDPNNADHRRFYHEFVQHNTWGRCPYRFVVPEDHGNLITMIQRKLVEYYVSQEFQVKKRRVTVVKRPAKV